jgi:indolepyruvate ferredoxin oxidoreductase
VAAHDPGYVDEKWGNSTTNGTAGNDIESIVERSANFLVGYQDRAYAERYRERVGKAVNSEKELAPGRHEFSKAVARSYFKLLAYKDEYEVARLYTGKDFVESIDAQFEGEYRLEFNLAPPWLSKRDRRTGEIHKKTFGPWMLKIFNVLKKFKRLRGTSLDPFSYTSDRKLERQLIRGFEKDLEKLLTGLNQDNYQTATAIAELPMKIRGYGHVKLAAVENVRAIRDPLWESFDNPQAAALSPR